MNSDNNCFYFIFKGNRRIQVTQERWEQSWLEWWQRISEESEEKEES